ncbi:MAG: AAA family ATPase [Prevotella sp.]|nr:AAA family ATPase [Prevotella sp.]
MSENNNIQQPQDAMEAIRPYLLDATQDYPEPYYMLEFNGIPFSTIGGIQALSGQKKNGKTFVIAQLIAAILGTGTEKVRHFLPGLAVPQRTLDYLGHMPKVLWVDTEMEKLNSAKVLRRIHWLCGWDMNKPDPRFNVLWLRGVIDVKDENDRVVMRANQKRWQIIRQAIDILNPDAVFIDGIRDIIGDFNDNKESAALVGELMSLAEQKGICIWNVLHMNPRPSNDDESKMRGHLGTELGNKVTDTLVSYKKKDSSSGRVLFTVKQQDARGKDMDDWQFEVTEDAGALGVPRIVGNVTGIDQQQREEVTGDDPEQIKQWITEGIHKYHFPMTRSDVKKLIFADIGNQKNSGKQQADLNIAINLGYLENSTMKSGNGSYMLQPPEDLVF